MLQVPVLGVPVRVAPSFFLVALVLSLGAGRDLRYTASWIAVVTLSILVHELGHALAIRRFGGTPSIELYSLGGLTSWGESSQPISRGRSIAVSLAGPGAGFVVGALLWAASQLWMPAPGSLAATALRQALWVNVGWGLINLLPIIPLDGGRVMQELLAARWNEAGERRARQLSIALGVAAGAYALVHRSFWSAFLAVWAVQTAYRELRARGEATADVPHEPTLEAAQQALQGGEPEQALALTEPLLASLRSPHLRAWMGDLRTRALLALDRPEEAQQALALVTAAGQTPQALRVGQVLIALGRGEEAVATLERAVEAALRSAEVEGGTPLAVEAPALLLGEAYLKAGRAGEVVTLLREITTLRREVLAELDAQLFAAGRFVEAAEVAAVAFNRHAHRDDAYNAACSHARLGQLGEGLGWIGKAIEAGYVDAVHLEADEDLAPLRAHPGYAAVRARLGE